MLNRIFSFIRSPKRTDLHFLHIGKTGGTAVKHAIGQIAHPSFKFRLHPHAVTLPQIPVGQPVVFFLRDPIQRFVSGFYSRQRRGKPRYHVPWTPAERQAFELFETPNQVAESLASDHADHRRAVAAMRGINHIRFPLRAWFQDLTYLQQRFNDLFFIGFQETLAADFETLKIKLSLDEKTVLPGPEHPESHKNPTTLNRHLSDKAQGHLQQWFEQDYAFLDWCRQQKTNINARTWNAV